MFDAKHITIGKIVAAHGVRGEVKVVSYTDVPEAIFKLSPVLLGNQPARLQKRGGGKDAFVVAIAGVADRNAAELLKGKLLTAPREALPEIAAEDEFYLEDLVGLEVRVGGKAYATVVAVVNYGASDIVEVKRAEDGVQEMFAFTEANFPELDIAAGWIALSPPEEV